jgi:hypothetical protein
MITQPMSSGARDFLAAYPSDFGWERNGSAWGVEDTVNLLGSDSSPFTEFMSQFAAPSHGNAVLKFFSRLSIPTLFEWNSDKGWRPDWPKWRERLVVFAYDWNGSQFGFDLARKRSGELLVSILEPDSGELLQTPHSFSEFLVHAASDEADAALSMSFYQEWLKQGGQTPKPGMCVGTKVPLFLNGSDTVDNLSLQDLTLYVSLCGQMFTESRKYPPGTKFSGARIS